MSSSGTAAPGITARPTPATKGRIAIAGVMSSPAYCGERAQRRCRLQVDDERRQGHARLPGERIRHEAAEFQRLTAVGKSQPRQALTGAAVESRTISRDGIMTAHRQLRLGDSPEHQLSGISPSPRGSAETVVRLGCHSEASGTLSKPMTAKSRPGFDAGGAQAQHHPKGNHIAVAVGGCGRRRHVQELLHGVIAAAAGHGAVDAERRVVC